MIDLNKNLIFVKGEDKTKDIMQLNYEDGYTLITYTQGGSSYRYNSRNVICYKDPKELSPLEYHVLKSGQTIKNVVRIQQFERHIRVFFKTGCHEVFNRESIVLMPSCLREAQVNDRFAYFRELSHVDTLLGSDGMPILGKRYDKIDFVRDDSILSVYLRGKNFENKVAELQTKYYPFGFNASQMHAVNQALNNRLSVIEGPPGTGKTQTILNIIANILMRGQSVAVVSSNNSAIENIEEKLKKYNVDFISAFLGSAQNKEAFLLKQKKIPLEIAEWNLCPERAHEILNILPSLHQSLVEKLEKKNLLSTLKLEADSLHVEQRHFLMYYTETYTGDIDLKTLRRLKPHALLKLIAICEQQRQTKLTFWKKLYILLHLGFYDAKLYRNSSELIVAFCQRQFYEARLCELKNQITTIEQELCKFDFNGKMQEYSDLSMKLFRHHLAQKYENHKRREYLERDLWQHSDEFINEYPIVLSTTHSLRSSLSNQYVYDYVIVDEASQVSLSTGVLAFSCAQRAVIVGDLKQLPNVVDTEMRCRTDEIFARYKMPTAYRYSDHSLLLSIIEQFPDLPRTLLREHYRCNPKIINFCNQKYYDNQLLILTEDNEDRMPLLSYRTTPGNHARDHLNQREIDVICNEVIPQQKLDVQSSSIGIITPYRKQADALQKVFGGTQTKADTVDKFQGQERDVIILSTVDNDISDFADDDHRLNVAISRAVKQLIVVISGNAPTRETGIGDLVRYIQYNNMDVINSEVYSVFDLLYKQYANVRSELMSKREKISKYDSENLMNTAIGEVLKEGAYNKLDVSSHVPLRMILRDLSKLKSDRETQFVMNVNTHADFLFSNKLSHQPVLILEVDGGEHRKDGSAQQERDDLKNQICARYNIPLKRFRTIDSDEKKRLALILDAL